MRHCCVLPLRHRTIFVQRTEVDTAIEMSSILPNVMCDTQSDSVKKTFASTPPYVQTIKGKWQ